MAAHLPFRQSQKGRQDLGGCAHTQVTSHPRFLCLPTNTEYLSKRAPQIDELNIHVISANMTKEEVASMASGVRQKHGTHLTDDPMATFQQCEHEQPIGCA